MSAAALPDESGRQATDAGEREWPAETLGSPDEVLKDASFRQDQYEFIWGTERHSLLLLEPKMLRCIRSGPYAPYSFNYLVTSESGRTHAYATTGMKRKIIEYGRRYLDPAFIEQVRDDYREFAVSFREYLYALQSVEFEALSNQQLDDHYERYFQFLIDTYTFFALTFGWKLDASHQALKALLAATFDDEEERLDAEVALSTSAELDEIALERIAWLRLVHQHRSASELSDQVILRHVRQFPWLVFNTYDLEDILSFFRMKLEQSLRSEQEPLAEIESLHAGKNELRWRQRRLLERIGDPQAAFLADNISWASKERLAIKWFWAGGEFLALGMLQEISGRVGVSLDDFIHTYKRADIQRFLLGGERLPEREMARRRRCMAYLVADRKLFCCSGEEAFELWGDLVDREEEATDELRGTPAFKGRAAGEVRIIKVDDVKSLERDFQRFQPGDVMVTTMTQPNILMLVQRASAVLTDEGGLTSHAALICRELQIPCILGLRKATRILREGDRVLVDADAGWVRRVLEIDPSWVAGARQLSPRPSPRPISGTATSAAELEDGARGGSKRSFRDAPSVVWLHELRREDRWLAGGKAAQLGELMYLGEVPGGFCITAAAYQTFVDEHQLATSIEGCLDGIEPEDLRTVEQASLEIARLIRGHELDSELVAEIESRLESFSGEPAAVRSSSGDEDSAAASFAGQHDSYLFRRGVKEVMESIVACWTSLYTRRSIVYRARKSLPPLAAPMAVVVQQMIDADYAGVLFTVHPVVGRHLLIEIIRGVGEELVSGRVTPDSYVVSESGAEILQVESTFALDEALVFQLADVGRRVERHFELPMDIEFAIQGGRVYLLQARPITTL